METDIDHKLLKDASEGNFEAFDELVRRHERSLYVIAKRITKNRADAEDVVQQTFVSVLRRLGDFRGDSSFRTWASRIATNHAIDTLRRRSALPTLSTDQGADAESPSSWPEPKRIARWNSSPEELAQHRETVQLLEAALEELDDKYRLVFILRDIEGFPTKKTAELLDISENNVRVRLIRARLMLRERLAEFFTELPT